MKVREKHADIAILARPNYIIFKGFTEEGKRFRPSDWVDRLATAVGQCGTDRRVIFHPHVRIASVDGEKCLIVDLVLEEEDPLLFGFLMRFAQNNNLQTERKATITQEGKHQVRVG